MEYGVVSSDLLPSLNAVIPVFVMRASFPQEFNFGKAFNWLLIATRDGRYSGSATTVLDRDTKQIRAKKSFAETIDDLTALLSAPRVFTAEDFREEYTDKFLRLILYLTVFNSKAKDWINQEVRIGFDKEDSEINEGFKPEWHHVFPRKVVKDSFDSSLVDSIANIAVLNEKANRSFSGKEPRQYLKEHNVKPERLDEQAVPAHGLLEVSKFKEFLKVRAEKLAERATAYVQALAK
jgi:hypothetical protein